MATSSAPFFVGGPIPTAQSDLHLHDYEEERRIVGETLTRRTPARLAILGHRSSGKTSLLYAVAPQMPGQRIHVECGRIWPQTPSGLFRTLSEALGGPAAEPPRPVAAGDVYAGLPMPRKGAKGVLSLENAHHLGDVDPELLATLPRLAERLPYHLVLTGTGRALRPFAAEVIELKPFSEASTSDFLRRRFARVGMQLGEGALPIFYEFTQGHPESLQRLGLQVWQAALLREAKTVTAELVDAALFDVVDRLPTHTVATFAGIKGLTRDIFLAMCLQDLSSPTAIGRRLGIEPKNVVVLLSRLVEAHGLVERVDRGEYRVVDPLLKHHVRKEWGSPILRAGG